MNIRDNLVPPKQRNTMEAGNGANNLMNIMCDIIFLQKLSLLL